MSPNEKEELLNLLEERAKLKEDSTLKTTKNSIIQREFLFSRAKTRILCGANRSGKTYVGAEDISIRSGAGMPDELKDSFPMDLIRPGEYWVTSVDFPSSRDVAQKKVFQILPKRSVVDFNKEYRAIKTTFGSEIAFKSADSGREKFQGTSKLGDWVDEEVGEDIWDESFMRTIDCSGWMSKTFSPIKGLTWAYQKLWKKAHKYFFTKNKHGITEEIGIVHTIEEIEKLKDRELIIMPNTTSEADPNIEAFQMAIYDNPYLSCEQIQITERKYKDDPAQYNARILGKFTKLTGRNVLDVKRLMKMQGKCPFVCEQGDIVNGQFKKSIHGKLFLFRDLKKIKRSHYVIGADVAEGLEKGDYSCAQILDHRTLEQVGIWVGKCSPEEFAGVLFNIGRFFNNAFLAPERNLHGFGVVNRLRDHFRYGRLFFEYDVAQQVIKGTHTIGQKKYGWETNTRTKAVMIQDLAAVIAEDRIKLNDINTIDELITYVYDNDGKTGAMGGCFDDRVIALAIAIQIAQRRAVPSLSEFDRPVNEARVDPYTGY